MYYYYTSLRLQQKRFRRSLKSKHKRKAKRRQINSLNIELQTLLEKDYSYFNILNVFLPKNLKYLLWCEDSPIYIEKLDINKLKNGGVFMVPSKFSLIEHPEISHQFINDVVSALIYQKAHEIVIDYSKCYYAGLEAQIFFDAILKDVISFYKRCRFYKQLKPQVKKIKGENAVHEDVRKMLFSVGSPAIHANSSVRYADVIPYKLCVHNSHSNNPKTINRKDIDTTTLADYVIKSLERLNRRLTDEKLEDLCIVISEILINAEEHSSTNFRYSIGYFTEVTNQDVHYGVFRLVIMNFGQTIYEKFKDPDCPNKHSVTKMKELSAIYNKRNFFLKKEFEEETLWTLYSLQEGITSTDPKEFKKRGNGSIRFIESFFNLKGEQKGSDRVSKMVLMSGNSQIVFDGTYQISNNVHNGENFQYVTFNESGNIMNKPDSKFVTFAENYFPGTIISAEILLNEDDFEHGNN